MQDRKVKEKGSISFIIFYLSNIKSFTRLEMHTQISFFDNQRKVSIFKPHVLHNEDKPRSHLELNLWILSEEIGVEQKEPVEVVWTLG